MALFIDRNNASSVLMEVSQYLANFANLIDTNTLSPEAKSLVNLVLEAVLHEEIKADSEQHNVEQVSEAVCDDLPNEYNEEDVKNYPGGCKITPEGIERLNQAPRMSMDDLEKACDHMGKKVVLGAPTKVTPEDLLKAWLDEVKTYDYNTLFYPDAQSFIKTVVHRDLMNIGVEVGSFAHSFLMNVCNLDWKCLDTPCDNMYTCERIMNEQLHINLSAHNAATDIPRNVDLNKSEFFGFGGSYQLKSMTSMNILDTYIELISSFLQLVQKEIEKQ